MSIQKTEENQIEEIHSVQRITNRQTEEDQNEIIQFYQQQLIDLKEMLYNSTEHITRLESENILLQHKISNLKENNASLSQTVAEIQSNNFQKIEYLEGRLATMSFERAQNASELDNLTHQLILMRRSQSEKDNRIQEYEIIIKNLKDQIEALASIGSLQLESQRSGEISQDLSADRQIRKLSQIQEIGEKKALVAEDFKLTNEEFIELRQQNKTFLSLFDTFKSALNKGESLRERNEQNFKLMMENLPSSSYKILYDQELSKLQFKDTTAKSGEMMIWEQEVMSLFAKKKQKNDARIQEKIGQYIRNFFPEQFRGKIWKFLVGNELKITKSLYNKLLKTINNHPSVTEELLHLLNNDLKRTFQFINNFDNQVQLKDDLREMLIIFHIFRPDIGYVQGMTYIAFMFLIRMDKIKAFKCFVNLIFKSKMLRSLYGFKNLEIEAYFQSFNYFLNEKLPELGKHMSNLEIPKQSFLVEWLYTLYARAFNLVISTKVWDYFLFEGDSYLFRVCLGIFSEIQNELIQCEYEDSLILIRNCSVKLSEINLFSAIKKIKISKNSFQSRFDKEVTNLLEGNSDSAKIIM